MANLNRVSKQLEVIAQNTTQTVADGVERQEPLMMMFVLTSAKNLQSVYAPEGYTLIIEYVQFLVVADATAANRYCQVSDYNPYDVAQGALVYANAVTASKTGYVSFTSSGAVCVVGDIQLLPLPFAPFEIWPLKAFLIQCTGLEAGDSCKVWVRYQKKSVVV